MRVMQFRSVYKKLKRIRAHQAFISFNFSNIRALYRSRCDVKGIVDQTQHQSMRWDVITSPGIEVMGLDRYHICVRSDLEQRKKGVFLRNEKNLPTYIG